MPPTLLVIDSSGRNTRSITRRLTQRFATLWRSHHPEGRIIHRDVGLNPPPPVDEAWIASAFTAAEKRTPAMRDALRVSDELIDELSVADCVVLGAPVYNFGMPAQLKAYFDQIVRVGRTFAFEPGATDPYQALLPSKPVVIATAAGDGTLLPGGAMAHLNFLDRHLETLLGFIGLTEVAFVRVGYEEFQDDRLSRSLAAAETAIGALAVRHTRSQLPTKPDEVGGLVGR